MDFKDMENMINESDAAKKNAPTPAFSIPNRGGGGSGANFRTSSGAFNIPSSGGGSPGVRSDEPIPSGGGGAFHIPQGNAFRPENLQTVAPKPLTAKQKANQSSMNRLENKLDRMTGPSSFPKGNSLSAFPASNGQAVGGGTGMGFGNGGMNTTSGAMAGGMNPNMMRGFGNGGGMGNMMQGGAMGNMMQGGAMGNMMQGGAMGNTMQGGAMGNMMQGGGMSNMMQGGGTGDMMRGGSMGGFSKLLGGGNTMGTAGGARPGLFQQNAQAQKKPQGLFDQIFGGGDSNSSNSAAAQDAYSFVSNELSKARSFSSQAGAYMERARSTDDRSAKSSAASEAVYYANQARICAEKAESRASGFPNAQGLASQTRAESNRATSFANQARDAASGW